MPEMRPHANETLPGVDAAAPSPAVLYLFWGAGLVAAVILVRDIALAIQGGHPVGIDFLVFWTAAKLTVSPELERLLYDIPAFTALQGETVAAFEYRPFPYPPSFLLLVSPLGALPLTGAWILWNAVTFAGLIWSVRHYLTRSQIGLLAIAPASILVFFTGQTTFLLAALVIGGMHQARGRPMLAGCLLAAAMCTKPHLALLIPFALVAARLWRALAAALCASALLVLVSAAVFGVDVWFTWLGFLQSFQTGLFERFDQFARSIPSVLFSAMLAGAGLETAMVLQSVAAGIGVAACAWAYWRTDNLALRCSVLLVGSLIMTPYAFNYDLVLVSIAALILFDYGRSNGFLHGELVVLIGAWWAPVIDGNLGIQFGLTVSPLIVITLLAYLLIRIEQERKRSAAALPQTLAVGS